MNCISLLTDFGLDDNFVGIMKGVILKINPRAKILDICHEVRPQDIFQAADEDVWHSDGAFRGVR